MMVMSTLSAQVLYYKEKLMADTVIILVGPQNVDRYAPLQTEEYMIEYDNLILAYEGLIEELEQDLFYYKGKRIQNKRRINDCQNGIKKCHFYISKLQNYIDLWIAHDARYLKSQNIQIPSESCYIIYSGDSLYIQDEITIATSLTDEAIYSWEYRVKETRPMQGIDINELRQFSKYRANSVFKWTEPRVVCKNGNCRQIDPKTLFTLRQQSALEEYGTDEMGYQLLSLREFQPPHSTTHFIRNRDDTEILVDSLIVIPCID